MREKNEEHKRRILERVRELAASEGVSFKNLMGTYLLGELALSAWEQQGIKKEPEEILYRNILRVMQEMRRILEEENR